MASLGAIEKRLAAIAHRRAASAVSMSRLGMAAALGLGLDPWQHEALASEARQILLNIHRQGGKSTVAAIMGLHEALSRPDALVLMVSPGERQSKLLYKKLLAFYRELGKPIPPLVENKLSLELANGSAIYALPGNEDTIRGFSAVTLLLVDEASRVADELVGAVRPMLSVSGGRLISMSTPFGARGWWWNAWEEGGASWARWEVPASQCPRISPEFLAEEERTLGPLWYASEYLCQFVDTDDQLFATDLVMAALSTDVATIRLPSFGEAA